EVDFPGALCVAQLQVHVRVAEADRLDRAGKPALLILRPAPAVVRGGGGGEAQRDCKGQCASGESHGSSPSRGAAALSATAIPFAAAIAEPITAVEARYLPLCARTG